MANGGITGNTTQWKIGIAALKPNCTEAAKKGVQKAVKTGFARSQELVHVRTGACKASGRIIETDGEDITFSVTYGGAEYGVDYAGWLEVFEPYLTPGMDEGLATYHSDPTLLRGPFG